MELDRTKNGNVGKYIAINTRKLSRIPDTARELASLILESPDAVEFGKTGSDDEFFLIKLKDRFALAALRAYAHTAILFGQKDYGREVLALSDRSGSHHRSCKTPD